MQVILLLHDGGRSGEKIPKMTPGTPLMGFEASAGCGGIELK
ncbi:hypothetical protein [Microcoleus vaginatus]